MPGFFAQLPQPEISAPTTIVGAFILGFITLMGLVVWIVKKVFDKTIPEQLAAFNADVDKLCASSEVAAQKYCDRFGEALEIQRKDCSDRIQAQSERFHSRHADLVNSLNAHTELLRSMDRTLKELKAHNEHSRHGPGRGPAAGDA